MRVEQRNGERPEAFGGALAATPVVSVGACRCGTAHSSPSPHQATDWPLATAWAWLTAPPPAAADGEPADDEDVDPASLPWWDARSRRERRRAVLSLVLLGELQAGVLLRALWEVLRAPPGPGA